MMVRLSELIRLLRERHGLRQLDLARMVGLSEETISKAERSQPTTPRTRALLYHALQPMSPEEDRMFRQLAGLSPSLIDRMRPALSGVPGVRPPAGGAGGAVAAEPFNSELMGLMRALVRAGGAERTRGALEGLLLTWSLQKPPDYAAGGGTRQVTVVEPPKDREHWTETIEHVYEVRLVEPPPKARRKTTG